MPINDNLEAMAKQLYDYWFVQFDFPNEDGKPYKSSGGAMVWNEKLKREIPQGWSDCVLGDYIGRITNGLNPRKNFVLGSGNNYYVTIRSLVGTTIDWNNCDRCDDEALSKINSRSQLQIGDIIFSAIGTIGRTYYIIEEPTNWNISETSFTLRAKENVPNDFFYGMLRSNEIQIKADKAAMGSTLRCLVMDSLCSLQYIKIPSYMMKLFAVKVSPLYRQIHRNNKEIAELTKQQDELLPLLMNGQATVNYHLSAKVYPLPTAYKKAMPIVANQIKVPWKTCMTSRKVPWKTCMTSGKVPWKTCVVPRISYDSSYYCCLDCNSFLSNYLTIAAFSR